MGEGKKEKEVYVNVYKNYYSSFFEYFLYAFYIVFLFVSKVLILHCHSMSKKLQCCFNSFDLKLYSIFILLING